MLQAMNNKKMQLQKADIWIDLIVMDNIERYFTNLQESNQTKFIQDFNVEITTAAATSSRGRVKCRNL